ncbi:hypothetical protein EDB89DRAFT_1914943 [Lactarius sanguifluus]|nr:hypothetical protein EDB89DRAFT_1914943 [Lactarius sanguifluus]
MPYNGISTALTSLVTDSNSQPVGMAVVVFVGAGIINVVDGSGGGGAIRRRVLLAVATVGIVLTAVNVMVVLAVVAVGVVLTPVGALAHTHAQTMPVGDSTSKILFGLSSAAAPACEGQGRSLRDGFKFSVHMRSVGSMVWRVYVSRAGAGGRGSSPVGRMAWAGEVVCSTSMLPSEAQNSPESENAFQRVSMLWSGRSGSQGGMRKMVPCLYCRPWPIHAHSSAPEPTPGSPGCPQWS